MIPIIPGNAQNKGNSLTLNGNYFAGEGFADFFGSLTGGISFPTLPAPMGMMAPTYAPGIDNGLVAFDPKTGALQRIGWRGFMVGLQYYLPPKGRFWLSGNYSQMSSPNIYSLVPSDAKSQGKVWGDSRWADANLLFDITPAVRLGLEYAYFSQTYGDGVTAINHRGQLSLFYIF